MNDWIFSRLADRIADFVSPGDTAFRAADLCSHRFPSGRICFGNKRGVRLDRFNRSSCSGPNR